MGFLFFVLAKVVDDAGDCADDEANREDHDDPPEHVAHKRGETAGRSTGDPVDKGIAQNYKERAGDKKKSDQQGKPCGDEAFFENVMVMDNDASLRRNRLNLLAELKALFDRTANLALLG